MEHKITDIVDQPTQSSQSGQTGQTGQQSEKNDELHSLRLVVQEMAVYAGVSDENEFDEIGDLTPINLYRKALIYNADRYNHLKAYKFECPSCKKKSSFLPKEPVHYPDFIAKTLRLEPVNCVSSDADCKEYCGIECPECSEPLNLPFYDRIYPGCPWSYVPFESDVCEGKGFRYEYTERLTREQETIKTLKDLVKIELMLESIRSKHNQ